MGRQIALNTAKYNYRVTLTDVNGEARQAARVWVDDYLEGRVTKGKMTREKADEIKSRFFIMDGIEEASKNADLVIEAIVENEEIKREFFANVSRIVREDTILATNSSRQYASLFKDVVPNPARLINAHYFNPALVMQLVEVVQGPHCSEETAQTMMEFARNTGKIPVLLRGEDGNKGFIVGRINTAILEEALRLVESGICTVEDVDLACEKGANHPMGPFRLRDLTGIDLQFDMLKAEYERTGVKPLGYDTFKTQYDQGRYGRKTGHGFYDYE